MSKRSAELARQYGAALRSYLVQPSEEALLRGYELGRQTLSQGKSFIKLARIHHNSLLRLLTEMGCPENSLETCRRAQGFLAETLWPFEVLQRGFYETNSRLADLNAILKERACQLEGANRVLRDEIKQRKEMERVLREREEELRNVSRQVLTAQEEERKRISRELHDVVGQALTVLHVNLVLLKRLRDNRTIGRKIADLQQLLEQTMETVHEFTRELRPSMLDHLGLVPAIRTYVRAFGKRTGLRVRFYAANIVENLSLEEKTVLYRVTQEGLTNVAKHAKATRATVLLRKTDGSIKLEVQDDGQAFEVHKMFSAKGVRRLGLLGIQERVRLVDGHFSLHSEPGKGTVIRVEIPYKTGGTKQN